MISDPLLSDDIATLLRSFPSDALEGVVGIYKRYTSWSPFPADRAYDAHALAIGADFTPHAEAIARELIWWGSHDFGRQVGMVPTWRDIVTDVAKQAGVEEEDRASCLPVWKIEQVTLRKVLAHWESMSPGQREKALREAGVDTSAARGGVTAAAGGLVRLGGDKLLTFLAARGVGLATAATVVAPLATVVGAAWTTHDLAGPSHRVLRPAVLTIAHTRQKLRDARAAGQFED